MSTSPGQRGALQIGQVVQANTEENTLNIFGRIWIGIEISVARSKKTKIPLAGSGGSFFAPTACECKEFKQILLHKVTTKVWISLPPHGIPATEPAFIE